MSGLVLKLEEGVCVVQWSITVMHEELVLCEVPPISWFAYGTFGCSSKY